MAKWLRTLILSVLNRSLSHRCGFKPSSNHMCDKSSSACGWSGVFFSGIFTRLKMSEIILTGRIYQCWLDLSVLTIYQCWLDPSVLTIYQCWLDLSVLTSYQCWLDLSVLTRSISVDSLSVLTRSISVDYLSVLTRSISDFIGTIRKSIRSIIVFLSCLLRQARLILDRFCFGLRLLQAPN